MKIFLGQAYLSALEVKLTCHWAWLCPHKLREHTGMSRMFEVHSSMNLQVYFTYSTLANLGLPLYVYLPDPSTAVNFRVLTSTLVIEVFACLFHTSHFYIAPKHPMGYTLKMYCEAQLSFQIRSSCF